MEESSKEEETHHLGPNRNYRTKSSSFICRKNSGAGTERTRARSVINDVDMHSLDNILADTNQEDVMSHNFSKSANTSHANNKSSFVDDCLHRATSCLNKMESCLGEIDQYNSYVRPELTVEEKFDNLYKNAEKSQLRRSFNSSPYGASMNRGTDMLDEFDFELTTERNLSTIRTKGTSGGQSDHTPGVFDFEESISAKSHHNRSRNGSNTSQGLQPFIPKKSHMDSSSAVRQSSQSRNIMTEELDFETDVLPISPNFSSEAIVQELIKKEKEKAAKVRAEGSGCKKNEVSVDSLSRGESHENSVVNNSTIKNLNLPFKSFKDLNLLENLEGEFELDGKPEKVFSDLIREEDDEDEKSIKLRAETEIEVGSPVWHDKAGDSVDNLYVWQNDDIVQDSSLSTVLLTQASGIMDQNDDSRLTKNSKNSRLESARRSAKKSADGSPLRLEDIESDCGEDRIINIAFRHRRKQPRKKMTDESLSLEASFEDSKQQSTLKFQSADKFTDSEMSILKNLGYDNTVRTSAEGAVPGLRVGQKGILEQFHTEEQVLSPTQMMMDFTKTAKSERIRNFTEDSPEIKGRAQIFELEEAESLDAEPDLLATNEIELDKLRFLASNGDDSDYSVDSRDGDDTLEHIEHIIQRNQ